MHRLGEGRTSVVGVGSQDRVGAGGEPAPSGGSDLACSQTNWSLPPSPMVGSMAVRTAKFNGPSTGRGAVKLRPRSVEVVRNAPIDSLPSPLSPTKGSTGSRCCRTRPPARSTCPLRPASRQRGQQVPSVDRRHSRGATRSRSGVRRGGWPAPVSIARGVGDHHRRVVGGLAKVVRSSDGDLPSHLR